MTIQGTIKEIGEVESFGSNNFQKRNVVITTDEQYPQHILIEFVQDKTDLIDPYVEGGQVKVSINLRGREWTNPQGEVKYFNSIQGWRIERLESPPVTNENDPPLDDLSPEEEDDLPF